VYFLWLLRNVKNTFKQITCIQNLSHLREKKLQRSLIIILKQAAVSTKENVPDDGQLEQKRVA
jgi:hypothetical protein